MWAISQLYGHAGCIMKVTRRLCGCAFLTAILLHCSLAPAAFIFTSQNRLVTGQLSGSLGGAGPQTISAPGFGLFDATTNLTVPTYGGSANQHQFSQLLPDAITV